MKEMGFTLHEEDLGAGVELGHFDPLCPKVPAGPKDVCHHDTTTSKRPRRPSPGKVSMHVWCGHLLRAALKTRTSFSEFIRRCNHLQRSNIVSSSPAMPLPLPFLLDFEAMPSSMSCRQRSKLYFRRAINLVVLALNFWWADCKHVDLDLMRRTPSWQQRLIYDRIACLLRVDGPRQLLTLASGGRRMPQLCARLGELSEALTHLGPGSDPYSRTFPGREVPVDNSTDECLEPYRSLDAERLKISGTGEWDPTDYLGDTLSMAFRNPDSLLFEADFSTVALPKINDPLEQIVKLCHVWDERGLLLLHEHDVPGVFPEETVRIFNAYKSSAVDRQIGDRRGRNATEARVEGPSKNLPVGQDLVEMYVDPKTHTLRLSVTDRKDFYHQIRCSYTRAISNTLGPGIPPSMLEGTKALASFLMQSKKKKASRTVFGDELGKSTRATLLEGKQTDLLYASFRSVLQGDHGGVEYACDAHHQLLASRGLLHHTTRLVSDRPFRGVELLEGLCIDDYFAISIQRKGAQEETLSKRCFDTAQEVYKEKKILGSPDKDLVDVDEGRVIGAFINAGEEATNLGLVTIGAPPGKRYSLALISLRIAQLTHTTDCLHVCLMGGWTSVLLYRRPLMSIFSESFKLVDATKIDPSHPRMIRLPRSVAQELCLASILVLFAVSNIATPFASRVFCSDASVEMGAFCSSHIDAELSECLWKCTRSKGAYHRLLSPAESLSKRLGLLEERGNQATVEPDRPLAFHYDFIEIFSGASKISDHLAMFGFVVGPPIDLSHSPEYNMEWFHVISWLTFIVSTRRVLAFMCEPPCTTFSIMRRPPLRSRLVPYGYNPLDNQTHNGNLLCQRSCQLLWVGLQNKAIGLLEKPFTSLMKHMPSYKALLDKKEVFEVRTDSCMFGSPHQKSFAMLGFGMDPTPFIRRCDRSHIHVKVEGSFTKASATYTDELANKIAYAFGIAIRGLKNSIKEEGDVPKGLENQLINRLALGAPWETEKSWRFRGLSHINIKELSAVSKLSLHLAKQARPTRAVCMVDSFVVSSAVSKGRTSSRGLMPLLRRLNATLCAGDFYLNTPFVPTRLNPADDPTRGVPLRLPIGHQSPNLDRESIFQLSSVVKLRRWSSNWVRLVIGVLGVGCLDFSDRSSYRQAFLAFPVPSSLPLDASPPGFATSMDFDSTLGFPGEGPSLSVQPCALTVVPIWFCSVCLVPRRSWLWVVVGLTFLSGGHVLAMDTGPRNQADLRRQAVRVQRAPLPKGRPVLPQTSENREWLFQHFRNWCISEGCDIDFLLQRSTSHIEDINTLLSAYGRKMYDGGRPYGQFAETINAVVQEQPNLRRLLQPSWDVAFAWVRSEPPSHRLALPWQIFLAVLSLSLSWGWSMVAGALGLMWGGLLRPGELLASKRSDLLLPMDTNYTNGFALLAIEEPKTRYTAARHQCAKIDSDDILRVLELAYRQLRPHEKLWPFSGQLLRSRFRQLLSSLGLQTAGSRTLELSSLRPGAATWLLTVTENAELTRRRGRWISPKVMEIYVQETSAARFMVALTERQRECVFSLANVFLKILDRCEEFHRAAIPPTVWFKLLSSMP